MALWPLTKRMVDGKQLPIRVLIDEFTGECLANEMAQSFTARDVIMTLQYLFAVRGAPEHLRSNLLAPLSKHVVFRRRHACSDQDIVIRKAMCILDHGRREARSAPTQNVVDQFVRSRAAKPNH